MKMPDQSEEVQLKELNSKKYDYSSYDQSTYSQSKCPIRSSNINKWRQAALVVAILSTIASFAIGIVETIVSRIEDSTAAFALAFTAILDALTSVVVCWRFFKETDIYSRRKEHIACIIFGIIITVSALGTNIKSIFDLVNGDSPDLSDSGERIMVTSSISSATICFVIFGVNLVIAKNLSSWVILSDAIDSLVGGIIALSIVITSEITKSNPHYWFLDETIAIITSVCLTAYGTWLTLNHCQKLEKLEAESKIAPSCILSCWTC